jgi:hypothetical protein
MSGQVVAVVLVLVGLGLVLVGLGARAGRRVERVSRRVGRARVTGTGGQAVAIGAVIASAQWAVFTWVAHPAALVAAFAVPALLAGAMVARLAAVAEIIRTPPRRGGRR